MNASNAADSNYEKILKDFSSKFIASIGSEGSLRGCLIPEAMALFDADWPRKKHDQYMKELGCTDQTSLLQKMDKGKIRLYLDEQSRWRVAVQKTEANAEELNHIDSAILRKKCGLRPGRSGNIIPPVRHPQTLFAMDEYKKGKISYDELTAIATASGTSLAGQQCPIPLRGANATPMPLNNVRAAGRNHQNGLNAFANSSFVPSSSFSAKNHQNGMNAFANSSFMPSSSFSVSTGMQSAKHRPTSFNRNEMLSLRRPPNITKTYIDYDQPRMNGHMATNGVHQRTNKFGLSGNEPATPMIPRLAYDPKEHSYFTASTRMYKNQLDSIKAEKSNEELKKAATLASSNGNGGMASSNGSGTTTSSSGSGGMTNLTDNLANISINDREDEDQAKENAINESMLAPIDDDDF